MITQNARLVICLPWMRALNKVYTKVPMVIMARQIDCTTPTVLGVGEHARNGAEQLFAHNAAHCGTNGQRGAGAEIPRLSPAAMIFAHGVAAHGKHGAP